MARHRSVAVRHFKISFILEIACRSGHKLVQPEIVVKTRSIDIYGRTLCRIHRRQYYIGGIFASPHHIPGLRNDKCIKFVDPDIAGIDSRQQCRQGFAFGIAEVILQLCKQSDSRHHRLVLEFGLLPLLTTYYTLTVKRIGRQGGFDIGFLYRVEHKIRNETAVHIDMPSQALSLKSGRIKHHYRRCLQIITVYDVVDIGSGSVCFSNDSDLERIHIVIQLSCQFPYFGRPLEPRTSFVWILIRKRLQTPEYGLVALIHVVV